MEAVEMNRWFVNACQEQELEVVVVDPTKMDLKLFGKKTDRRDAYELARRLRLGHVDRNAVTYFPNDTEFGVRKLVRTRHRLTQPTSWPGVRFREPGLGTRERVDKGSSEAPHEREAISSAKGLHGALRLERDPVRKLLGAIGAEVQSDQPERGHQQEPREVARGAKPITKNTDQ